MTRGRTMLPALALCTGLASLAGCSVLEAEEPDPRPAARRMAAGLSTGDLAQVFDRDGAAEEFAAVIEPLGDVTRTVEVESVETAAADGDGDGATRATSVLRWTWDLAEAGGGDWSYRTEAGLVREGEAWVPTWTPAVVEPSLTDGEVLEVTTRDPARGPVLGARGEPLVAPRPVTRFGITRDQVAPRRAAASARRLARLVGVEARGYAERVQAAGPRAFVEAITLRREDIPLRVATGYPRIEGALAVPGELHLGPTADFAEPLLGRVGEVTAEMIEEDPSLAVGDVRGISGLEARYDEQLTGTPGWAVQAVDPDEDGDGDGDGRTLVEEPPVDGEPLRVSLDEDLQLAAERILADVRPASALVALRPSDGAVLAAANGPGAGGVNIATYGQAAPGSTFKVVTSLALLRAGLTPDSPVACTDTVLVDGRTFGNYDDYPPGGLGRIPLRSAVASSCNTAFIAARDRVAGGGLAAAAGSLGMGIDHDLGFPAYFGQVPEPETETGAAADQIGQGGILASPMVMATVMASVQRGRTVVPWLVDQVRSDVPAAAEPLTGSEARDLRSMLRGVVTRGSGAALLDVPGAPVVAKTGTAEFDRDGKRLLHAWMVAARGDLAVAVYVDEGKSGSRTAGPLLEEFLRSAR